MTDKKNRTIQTNALFILDADKSDPILHSEFLLATESGLTKLWQLYHVSSEIYDAKPEHNTLDIFPVEEDLELCDMFNRLSFFERDKQELGFVENPDLKYPKAVSYQDAAIKRGVIFDLDTGKAHNVMNINTPMDGGRFAQKDIEMALRDIEKQSEAANDAHPSALESMLIPYGGAIIDYTVLFDAATLRGSVQIIREAIEAMDFYQKFLDKGLTEEWYGGAGYYRHKRYHKFEVIESNTYQEIHYDKSFQAANKALDREIANVKKIKDDVSKRLQDSVNAFRLCTEIHNLRQKLTQKYNGNLDLGKDQFQKDVQKLKEKYKGVISEENCARIDAAAIDIFNQTDISTIKADILSGLIQLEEDINKKTARTFQNAKNGRAPEMISDESSSTSMFQRFRR